MLKESVDRYFQQNYAFDQRRQYAKSEQGFGAQHWSEYADLGWLSIPFTEASGGYGGSMVDTVILSQAMGNALALEPFAAGLLLGGRALELLDQEQKHTEIIGNLMSGQTHIALAHTEANTGENIYCVETTASKDGDDYLINGSKTMVLNAPAADYILVSARVTGEARDKQGVAVFLLDTKQTELQLTPYRNIDDALAANVSFDNLRISCDAELGNPTSNLDAIEQAIDEAIVALSAEAIGAMNVLTNDTVEYTKTRKQFGVPLSAFQNLQFRMVDMWIAKEQCQSALMLAAQKHTEYGDEAKKATSALKVMVNKASRLIGEEAVQIHGGIGTTEELRVGNYFKRLLCYEALMGGLEYHLDRYAKLI